MEEQAEREERCRVPGDNLPYASGDGGDGGDEGTEDGAEGGGRPAVCFACTYGSRICSGGAASGSAQSGSGNIRHVYTEMIDIIHGSYGTVDNQVLVDMVSEFYKNEIQRYFNYPNWTKRSIWEHIHIHMQDDMIQASESIKAITCAMEHIRNAEMCTKLGDKYTIDSKSARLYLEMAKTRDALVANKMKRKAV